MPLYNDINLYYGSSAFTPTYPSSYSSPFSLPTRSGFSGGKLGLLPPPRLLPSRTMYSPLLPTISETSSFAGVLPRRPLGPLSRIGSPRITPTYLPPKPIRIDTADIDVSSPRVERAERIREQDQEGQEVSRPGTIKRGRTVIRLHTKRPKDNPALSKRKQTPGERLMEKFLIKDKIAEAAKEERQKRLEEQERLERLKAEETKVIQQLPPVEAHMPVMLTENDALDILVSTQEHQDSLADDNEGEAKSAATQIGKENTGKMKTKYDPSRRKSVPDEDLWMIMDDAAVEKSPLHRRNTVKKLRRNSHDLTNLETLTCPTSKRLPMDTDIVEERETEESEAKSDKKVTVKRKRGGKQKFVANITVDNAVPGTPTLMSPVKFVVGDIKVEESPASPKTLAKKFRYEVIVEDSEGSQEKGKKNKMPGEKKIKKKIKGAQDKKQTPKSPKSAEEKGRKIQLTSEKTKEESIEDCKTSKSFQVSRHANVDNQTSTTQNIKDYCVDVKQPVLVKDKLDNKENLSEAKSDCHKTVAQNKMKDKLDPGVERDEGYVSKRRRSSDPKLSKIKEKEVQSGLFVAEKKKSPIMVKIIPKMEDIKTGKRVVEKKKVVKRQEDPVISPVSGQTPTPQDSGVNFWAFLNSLDDEYQPVTLKTALSLDIVSPSDIASNDQITSSPTTTPSSSFLQEDDIKVHADSACTPSFVSKNDTDKSKNIKSADENPMPKLKLGKLAEKKPATRDKVSTTLESKLQLADKERFALVEAKKEETIPSTNVSSNSSDSKNDIRKIANVLPTKSKDLAYTKLIQENPALEENCLPKWKVKKPLENLNKQTTKDIPDVNLNNIVSTDKPLAKEIVSSKERSSDAKPADADDLKKESISKLTSSETTFPNVKARDNAGIAKHIPNFPESTEKNVPKWKLQISGKPDESLQKHQSKDMPPEKSGNVLKSIDDISNIANSSELSEKINNTDILTRGKEDLGQNFDTISSTADPSTASHLNELKGKILGSNVNNLESRTPKWKVNKKTEIIGKIEQHETPPSPSASANETMSGENAAIKLELSKQNRKFETKSNESPPKLQLKSPPNTKKTQENEPGVNLADSEVKGVPKWKVVKPAEKPKQPLKRDKTRFQSPMVDKTSEKTSVDVKNQDTKAESNTLPEDDFWGVITGTATVLIQEDAVKSLEVSQAISTPPTEDKHETKAIKTLEFQNTTDKRIAKVKTGKTADSPRKPLKKPKSSGLHEKELNVLSSNTALLPEEIVQGRESKTKESTQDLTENLICSPFKETVEETVSKPVPPIDTPSVVDISPESLGKRVIPSDTAKCVPKKKVDKSTEPIKELEKKKTVANLSNKTAEVDVEPVFTAPGKINIAVTNEAVRNVRSPPKGDSDSKVIGGLSPEIDIKNASPIPFLDPPIALDTPTPKIKNLNPSEPSKLIPKWKVKTAEDAPKLFKPKDQFSKNISQPLIPEEKHIAFPNVIAKKGHMESGNAPKSGKSAVEFTDVTAGIKISGDKTVHKSDITTAPVTKPPHVVPDKKLASKVKFSKPGEKTDKSLVNNGNQEILKARLFEDEENKLTNEKRSEIVTKVFEEKEEINKGLTEQAKELKSTADTLESSQKSYTDKREEKSKDEFPSDSRAAKGKDIDSPKDNAQAKPTPDKNKKAPGVKISKLEDTKPALKPIAKEADDLPAIQIPKLVTKKETNEINDAVSIPEIENVVSPEENAAISESVSKKEDGTLPMLPERTSELKKHADMKGKVSDSKPKKKVKVKKGAKSKPVSDTPEEPKELLNSSEAPVTKDELSSENTPETIAPVKTVKLDPEISKHENDDSCKISQDNSSSSEKKEEMPIEDKEEGLEVSEDVTNSESMQRSSTSSDDSGFDSLPTSKPVPSSSSSEGREPTSPAPSLASNPSLDPYDDGTETTSRPGWQTPPAVSLPRFRKYTVEDFQFLKVLGKGSFGKVLLAELKGTDRYYAVKCLKKDVVLEDDDVECTLIERKVLALGTKHPYLCHLFCTFQTESHLLFVMEYLNGGDLMFHIQQSGRFPEPRARFYAAEIVCGLKFLHKKGIVYRDLKLDNILLDFEGHVRIADFGMCKLQIFLERTADTFCGTPDYMAPEIIKGLKYNQCVDWWSFGVLLFEMLVGVSPFNGCDEDELFWSICNDQPHYPRFLSRESSSILAMLLEKDASKRLGTPSSGMGDVADHVFFRNVDWVALEHRELEPPFKPRVQHPLDVQYFDKAFTEEKAILTPIDRGILQSMDQTQFQGFSYTNPNATD